MDAIRVGLDEEFTGLESGMMQISLRPALWPQNKTLSGDQYLSHLMCNSSGSSRPPLSAVTAQHCCDPKTGLSHHPQHQSSCSQTPHTAGAAANSPTFGEENWV